MSSSKDFKKEKESLTMTKKLPETFICACCYGLGKMEGEESRVDDRSAKLWAWEKRSLQHPGHLHRGH